MFKGLAYSLSLGSFRGGPTFPAMFLGAAGGHDGRPSARLLAHTGGRRGMGAATAAILRLPLSAVVLATLLTVKAGTGDEPLIIVGVVVAYLIALAVPAPGSSSADTGRAAESNTAPEPAGG